MEHKKVANDIEQRLQIATAQFQNIQNILTGELQKAKETKQKQLEQVQKKSSYFTNNPIIIPPPIHLSNQNPNPNPNLNNINQLNNNNNNSTIPIAVTAQQPFISSSMNGMNGNQQQSQQQPQGGLGNNSTNFQFHLPTLNNPLNQGGGGGQTSINIVVPPAQKTVMDEWQQLVQMVNASGLNSPTSSVDESKPLNQPSHQQPQQHGKVPRFKRSVIFEGWCQQALAMDPRVIVGKSIDELCHDLIDHHKPLPAHLFTQLDEQFIERFAPSLNKMSPPIPTNHSNNHHYHGNNEHNDTNVDGNDGNDDGGRNGGDDDDDGDGHDQYQYQHEEGLEQNQYNEMEYINNNNNDDQHSNLNQSSVDNNHAK